MRFQPSPQSYGAPLLPKQKGGGFSPLAVLYAVSGPVAMGVSYARNKSIGWALLHGFISVPYLVYVGAQSVMKK